MIIFIFESRQSANEVFNHFAAELAELFVTAGVEVGELVVVEAEEVKQGDVKVSDGMGNLHGLGTDLIGGADNGAAFHAAAGHEHGHGIGVAYLELSASRWSAVFKAFWWASVSRLPAFICCFFITV